MPFGQKEVTFLFPTYLKWGISLFLEPHVDLGGSWELGNVYTHAHAHLT